MAQSEEIPKILVVHNVQCTKCSVSGNHYGHLDNAIYVDVPRLFAGDNKTSPLRGTERIDDVSSYIRDRYDDDSDEEDEENRAFQAVAAVFERTYDCVAYHEQVKSRFIKTDFQVPTAQIERRIRPYLFVLLDDGPDPESPVEKVVISNDNFLKTLRTVTKPETQGLVDIAFPSTADAPYFYVYHFRKEMKRQIAESQDETFRGQLSAFLEYILQTCDKDYSEADSLFAEGLVNQKHFSKLFGPNEILLQQSGEHPLAYMCESLVDRSGLMHELKCWSWTFDGAFRRTPTKLKATWPNSNQEEIAISSLKVFPLKYADSAIESKLRNRGRRIWNCREKAYVNYSAPGINFDVQMANPRFMIDMRTYNELHAETEEEDSINKSGGLDAALLDDDEPPSGDFVLLLPETVVGYGFHDKKWKTLQAEYITDIDWQLDAFERLVLDHDKKEIIRALVSVHADTVTSSDIIAGKGNALILLLHGSPGTGKTLTAESIAELTKKPLYRVTCGDVGIEPESVEKYLDSVLYIGTIWGCVVLLDEADVFLEERTQADLQRNALVSVFLRVLEYYNGILILTTNRVGTFDEAFKSRIQLSIHYPPLEFEGRLEIWINFFSAMEGDPDVEIAQLHRKKDLLALYAINGRQIRNTVKSARQLAHYKKEKLNYAHFEKIIKIAAEFDKYIEKAHGGNTDEQWARDSHTRA